MSYVTQNKQNRASAMGLAVLINGSIIVAVALSPMVAEQMRRPTGTAIFDVPIEKPKPPVLEEGAKPKPLDPMFAPDTPFLLPPRPDTLPTTDNPPSLQPLVGGDGTGVGLPADPQPVIEKPVLPPPVFVAAMRDPRYLNDFQPDYPRALEKDQVEGLVRLKVLIGRDGRVRQVQILNSTNSLFAQAAERQALKAWRFRPATRGGEAVEDWQTLTVRFSIRQ